MEIKVKIITNSSQQSIEELTPGEFKVRLKSVPVEGKANKELISLLADRYNIAKSMITIVRGKTSKNKIIEIVK
jgi:uncharacterized protein